MFGVDFSELAVIFCVALIVLGPKRMPGLVKKIGRWVGKARAMARDFQQQLENEVNLEELNKMTDLQSRQAPTPMTPPESTPAYPYSAPESSPAAEPGPADDTYSHAHAQGDAPVPYSPEAEPAAQPAETAEPAEASVPSQASLDLSTPEEYPPPEHADLPPDDARRYT